MKRNLGDVGRAISIIGIAISILGWVLQFLKFENFIAQTLILGGLIIIY
jgi:hypothetical protein